MENTLAAGGDQLAERGGIGCVNVRSMEKKGKQTPVDEKQIAILDIVVLHLAVMKTGMSGFGGKRAKF